MPNGQCPLLIISKIIILEFLLDYVVAYLSNPWPIYNKYKVKKYKFTDNKSDFEIWVVLYLNEFLVIEK